MVDHQINRVQRVNLLRVAAKRHDAVAHCREVHNRGHTGEILHQHAGRAVGDLTWVFAAVGAPFSKGLDVVDADGLAIFKPEHVLQHDFQCGRKLGEIAQTGSLGSGNRVIGDAAGPGGQRFACLGCIVTDGDGHGMLL